MAHPLVLALFPTSTAAAAGARALHGLGIAREQISVVSRNHDEAGALAEQMDASPGADIEDSRPAARLGELGGLVLAAMALVMPGIGPIVAAGPMSADLGEAAGHAAGGVASVLKRAGLAESSAAALQEEVEQGRVLIGVHVTAGDSAAVSDALRASGASRLDSATWPD
jgi:hypothetical protein